MSLYVSVTVLDFSKAFDSVSHSAVLGKFSRLLIPDNVLSLFSEDTHITLNSDMSAPVFKT